MALKILSPKGTLERDILFVIEEPSITRTKYRLIDIENRLKEAEAGRAEHVGKITEYKKLKKDMKALLNKA